MCTRRSWDNRQLLTVIFVPFGRPLFEVGRILSLPQKSTNVFCASLWLYGLFLSSANASIRWGLPSGTMRIFFANFGLSFRRLAMLCFEGDQFGLTSLSGFFSFFFFSYSSSNSLPCPFISSPGPSNDFQLLHGPPPPSQTLVLRPQRHTQVPSMPFLSLSPHIYVLSILLNYFRFFFSVLHLLTLRLSPETILAPISSAPAFAKNSSTW